MTTSPEPRRVRHFVAGRIATFLLLSFWLASVIAQDWQDRSRWLLADGLLLVLWFVMAQWALERQVRR